MEKPRNGSLIYQNGLLSLDDIPDTIVLIDHDLEVDALVSNVIDSEDIHGIVLSHMEKLDLLPPENNESDLIELQKHIEAIEIPSENPSSTTFKPAALQPIQSFVDTLHEAYDLYDQKVKLHMDLLTETFVPYGDDELPNINAVKAQQELQQYCIRFPPTVRYIYEKFKCLPIVEAGPIGLKALAAALIKNNDLDDSFYIYDVSNIQKLFEAWKTAMPRVIPYYAVKCCPMDAIIELLAVNGCGFDCASAGEIEKVLSLGINADRIIFAHPSKRPADIRYAAQNNVNITTFDSVIELQKISKWHPKCNLVLRIRADDPLAEISFGVKFGAMPNEYRKLLERAKSLNLNVLGVSFHVGSLAKSGSAFYEAIKEARKVFVIGKSLGFKFTLLDIGGGFTGRFNSYGVVQSMVGDIPASINKALDEFFGGDSDDFEQVKVIAEPGRYFAESSMHLCCHIHSFRNRIDENNKLFCDYLISDGLYGSFNAILYDGAKPRAWLLPNPNILSDQSAITEMIRSNIWGPTCDSMDCVFKNVYLPQLSVGDWFIFPNFGAYTLAGATNFNGIPSATPFVFYIVSKSPVDQTESLIMWSCEIEEGAPTVIT